MEMINKFMKRGGGRGKEGKYRRWNKVLGKRGLGDGREEMFSEVKVFLSTGIEIDDNGGFYWR